MKKTHTINISLEYIFILLCIVAYSNIFIMLPLVFLFFIITGINKTITKHTLFYLFMVLLSIISATINVEKILSYNYLFILLYSIFIWMTLFYISNNTIRLLNKTSNKIIEKSILLFFKLNVIINVFLYLYFAAVHKTINIYSVSGVMGDYIGGMMGHSRNLMIVFSFYSAYFYFRKENTKLFICLINMALTTFMSGLVIYFAALIFFLIFLENRTKWYKKVLTIFSISVVLLLLFLLSRNNILYAAQFITQILTDNPPRKIISFNQTIAELVSDIRAFLFGFGPGNFSSRGAFFAGGEYVDWYPSSLQYKSEVFSKNHFTLWNDSVLRLPFSDGTANQPFSVYNKIFGEYGILGFLSLIFIYLKNLYYSTRNNFAYKKILIILLLGYFLLDYWFEYISIIIFFEIFISLPPELLKNKVRLL